ncbi:MAG TPA: hypothetical protein VFS84_01440, partial [Candidatus Binatia bacterium]|nr:hypothetical protein [Candidatus Binatia bacterium]
MKQGMVIGLLVLLSSFYFGSVSLVSAQESFYKGKSIRLIVGSTPGGFYDRWARFFARYMPKYIPGNPEIAVQNMPAAGSLVAANYVYNVAKPDGLTLGMVQYNIYMDQ